MGEKAHRGYDEAEREAFRAMPLGVRLRANLMALVVTGGLALVVLVWAMGSF
jgi:hypothetical protein